MSGQWELVTKNKKDKQNGVARKLTKTEKKKFIENAPKVEDLLPVSKLNTLYSGLDPSQPAPVIKQKEMDSKKPQQKKNPQPQNNSTKKESFKDEKPKTLDAAMKKISIEEFKNIISSEQKLLNGTPLMWLKNISVFLNGKLNVELSDPVFSAKSYEYPLCLVPSAVRSQLKEALKSAGEENLRSFVDIMLTHLTHDMSKGACVVGTKTLLQLICTQYPKIALNAIPKCLSLQKSYQNSKPIWLSVLWIMGQAGFKDLSIGLQVWQEVMVPVIEMRNYSQFVIDYLSRLLGRHAAGPAPSVNQYLNTVDIIFTPFSSLSTQLTKSLHLQATVLRKIAVSATPDAKLHVFFQPLMDRLHSQHSDMLKKEIIEFLWSCLNTDPQCFTSWNQLYSKNVATSAALLKLIDAHWKSSETKISGKELKSTLEHITKSNATLFKSKPKTEGLQDCQRICEVI